jgi:hypothetical protein
MFKLENYDKIWIVNVLRFHMALQPNAGYDHLIHEYFQDHTHNALQSMGLLWLSYKFVGEFST